MPNHDGARMDRDRLRGNGGIRRMGRVRAVGWDVMETRMLSNEQLDRLDKQCAGVLIDLSAEVVQQYETTLDAYEYAEGPAMLTGLAGIVPELTAEIRRCWAELGRSDQVGMISLLRESRMQSWS